MLVARPTHYNRPMACRLCERPQRVPEGAGRVFLSAPVSEMTLKILESVKGWPEKLSAHDGALEATTSDFRAFLDRFLAAGAWSSLEREDISILFLPQGKNLTFASSRETRSLQEWIALKEGEFLARVIDDRSLTTHFHAIWDLKNEAVYGWECLTRGLAPDGSTIPPLKLFTAAAATNMTFPLDRLARQSALRNAHAAALPGRLFINFLPTAIYDPVFCLKTTVDLAATLGLDPAQIVFEVVESEHIQDEDHLKTIVDYYRSKGFRVALDDVGSGYSSLNLLVALQPDVIKVDLKIVRNIDSQPANQAVFEALAGIAQRTGALLLAEGVETAAELSWCQTHGADLAQGFFWGPPEANPDPSTFTSRGRL